MAQSLNHNTALSAGLNYLNQSNEDAFPHFSASCVGRICRSPKQEMQNDDQQYGADMNEQCVHYRMQAKDVGGLQPLYLGDCSFLEGVVGVNAAWTVWGGGPAAGLSSDGRGCLWSLALPGALVGEPILALAIGGEPRD